MAGPNQRQKAAAARAAALAGNDEELRAALQEERRGYVSRGLEARVKQVDAQLKALGASSGTAGETKAEGRPGGSTRSRRDAKPADDGEPADGAGESKAQGDGAEGAGDPA